MKHPQNANISHFESLILKIRGLETPVFLNLKFEILNLK